MSGKRRWQDKPFYSSDCYYKEHFGGKVYKLSLNGGMSCPNRDGTLDTRGCIFCSEGGSGDFAAKDTVYSPKLGRFLPDIPAQLKTAKELVSSKIRPQSFAGYIAYFQAYTNTYAAADYLKTIFMQAILQEDILGISIATRPDCLEAEKTALLARLNQIKPVYVELGLQTVHERTAAFIRRGYSLSCFEAALSQLKEAGIPVVVHVILGLPGETAEDMLATCAYLAGLGVWGVKLQLLHVLRGTDLGEMFLARQSSPEDAFPIMTLSEYAALVVSVIERLPPDTVIHRITGDGPKRLLLAPLWSADKKNVLNTIIKEFAMRDTWQGKYYDR